MPGFNRVKMTFDLDCIWIFVGYLLGVISFGLWSLSVELEHME